MIHALAIVIALALWFSAAQPLLLGQPAWWAHSDLSGGGVSAWYLGYAGLVLLANALRVSFAPTLLTFAVELFVIGGFALRAVSLVLLVIGVIGALSPEASNAMPLALIPGAMGFLLSGTRRSASAGKADVVAWKDIGANDKAPISLRALLRYLAYFIFGALMFAVLLRGHFVFGYAVVQELTSRTAVGDALWSWLSNYDAFLNIAAPLLSVAAAFSALIFLLVLGFRLFDRRKRDKPPPVTDAEIAHLDAVEKALVDYAERNELGAHGSSWWHFYAILVGHVLLAFGLGFWGFSLEDQLEAARIPAAAAWSIYNFGGNGPVFALLIAASLLLSLGADSVFRRRTARGQEAEGWQSVTGEDWDEFRENLVDALRAGKITPGQTFDAGAFLYGEGRASVVWSLAPGVVLAALAAFLLRLDFADYDLITPDRIVTVDFWTSTERTHAFSDVTRIDLECVNVPQYVVNLRSGDAIEISVWRRSERLLDHLTALDEKLRAQGVKAAFRERTRWLVWTESAYSEDCVKELVDKGPPERAAQIERILHLDDWRGRE